MAAPSNLSLFGLPFPTGLNEADFNSPASSNSLSQLFGINAPTGPFLPQGTVSPLSDLFSQIPTGLANNQVTYSANNVTSDPGSMFLPTGSQWTPKPGYDIVYGVRQGTYGHFQIPSADVANAAQKYGIQVFGTPLTQQDINYHNNPSGGANQPGVVTAPSGGNTPPVTTPPPPSGTTPPPSGGTPPPSTPTPPTTPQLPALTGNRQSYLTAIDAYLRSLYPYQTIDDTLRRANHLPGMTELQMNQQANPQGDPANFVGNYSNQGYIPGAAPPSGFKWVWVDPDKTDSGNGPNPGNYALVPSQDFFDKLPGTRYEDLQSLLSTYQDPTYANKFNPTKDQLGSLLGGFANFINYDPSGRISGLAPAESYNLLAPYMENADLGKYFSDLLGSVQGQLGSQYNNFSIQNNLNDPTKLNSYFGAVNQALGLNNLPSLQDLLSGNRRSLNSNYFANTPLDFYSPQDAPPAYFQYMLGDWDNTGPNPSTYRLKLLQNPNTRYDAQQIVDYLNNPNTKYSPTGLPANIFNANLGVSGKPVYSILSSYSFPGGLGGPSSYQQSINSQTPSSGAPESTRWQPTAQDTSNANRQQADMANNTQTQATALNGLYGSGGGGTTGLPNTPSPSTPNTTTTPDPNKPDPFSGLPTPTTGYQRPPKFWSPWAGF